MDDKSISLLERIAAATEFLAMQQGHVPPKPPVPAPAPAAKESQRGAEQKKD
jgi:hypothetical protein